MEKIVLVSIFIIFILITILDGVKLIKLNPVQTKILHIIYFLLFFYLVFFR